jgi:RNA polymerase sigma-70 factor (ECF subfamily)
MSGDESRLVQQAKNGDPAAFAELYSRHHPAIYRYVLFQVGDVAVAEDLASEVFVRLVEKIDQFSYRGRPLLAWLYTVARNLVTDHHRRAERSPLLPLDEQQEADTTGPEQVAERRLMAEEVIAAVAGLTEGQRQVVLLKFIQGLDNETVAQTLGKSVGAVKSLQHRALAELRIVLERHQG